MYYGSFDALRITKSGRAFAFLSLATAALIFALSAPALAQTPQGQAHVMAGAGVPSSRTLNRPTPAGHIVTAPVQIPHQGPFHLLTEEGKRGKTLAERGEAGSTTKMNVVPVASAPLNASPTTNAPQTGTFLGVGFTGSVPPDGAIAAGPHNIVQYVNDTIQFRSKVGTLLFSNSFSGFTGLCDSGDTQVLFNPFVQRFFALAIGCPMNHVTLAVSNTNDATQGWHSISFDVRANSNQGNDFWCDYPHMGFSALNTYISCNMFNNIANPESGSFQYANVDVINSVNLANGGTGGFWVFWNMQNNCFGIFSCAAFTVQPAREINANSGTGEFWAWARGQGSNDDHLELIRVNNEANCCNGVGMSNNDLQQNNIGVGGFNPPPSAPQPGGVQNLDTGDTRLLSAWWQNGHLSVSQNLNDNNQSGIGFTQLNVGSYPSISTISDWALGGDGLARYYPAVAGNNAEQMIDVYSASNTGTFVQARQLGIPSPSSCTNCIDFEGIMASGASTYSQVFGGKNRWGDYFGVYPDPDGVGVWAESEFVASTDAWGTVIGLYYDSQFPNPAPVLNAISPSSISAGSSFTEFAFGFDFVNGAVITLNGVSQPTTFDSTGQLHASIAGTSIANSGNYNVAVCNPAPQGGCSAARTLTVTPAGPPSNDNVASALAFTTPFSTSENTTGATVQGTDPSSCGSVNSHSVWFKYTATVPGTLTLSTAGSSYDTVLSAYTGAPGSFVNVACDDDFGGTLQSQISFAVTAGVTYSVEVQSFSSTSGGNLNFSAKFLPNNDSWTNRFTALSPAYHAPAEDTTQTTVGGEDPVPTCGARQFNTHSVWFSFTPTSTGMVYATTQGSNYDTVASVWTGTPGLFSQKACSDDFYGLQSMAPFYAQSGTPYSIMVQSFSSAAGGNLLFNLVKQDLLPSPSSLTFSGKTVVGATSSVKSVTIKNQNTNTVTINSVNPSANFTLSSDTCSGATLTPGATCSIGVRFAPTNTGTIKGNVRIVSNGNNSTLILSATGTAVYPLSFNVTSITFPTTAVGSTSATKNATLVNNTAASIPLGAGAVSPDFHATSNCGAALAAHSSCTYQVSFSPNRPVATNGVVTVNATTSPASYYLSLSGTGSGSVTTQMSVTATASFSPTFAGGTSANKTVTVKNTGSSAITISGTSVNGPFGLSGGTCTTLAGGVLSGGLSCTYILNASPLEVGAVKGAFTIRDNDPTARQIVNLSVTGEAAVTFKPTSVSYGSLALFTNSAQTVVTITNTTSATINGLALATSGNFFIASTTCGATLASNASCTANVFFSPSQGGSINGSLSVSGSQPGSAQVLNLTGSGN